MNYFYDLPPDIQSYIFSFVKIFSVNMIIKAWKNYNYFKKFIMNYAYTSPVYHSCLDGELLFNVSHEYTAFYFNILNNITTGNESYIHDIYLLFCSLAISISDYEDHYDINNFNYSLNKYYFTSITHKLNWYSISHLID